MKSSKGLEGTGQDSKKGTETVQTNSSVPFRRLAKSHADYWLSRLVKRSYTDREGRCVEMPEWHVRLRTGGKQVWFNLATANRSQAATKAKAIYAFLEGNGWDATLAKFKSEGDTGKAGCTVGEFLDEVKAVSGLKPATFEIYRRKFCSLVADVFNLHGNDSKHDYVHGGHEKWNNRIRAVRLDRLTPERVNKWKVKELKAASHSPLKLKHAEVTVRSVILSSKALFAPKIRKHLTAQLPNPLPFDGIELPKLGKSRYRSEINPALLLQQAQRELAEGLHGEGEPLNPRPELFKIVLLALGAGLRRDEIDTLQWSQIQWHRNAIVVETTEHGGTKSADSEADVDVDPGLLEVLKEYLPKPGAHASQFVIESPVEPRPDALYPHYRCERLFKQLVLWLRGKGIKARNAIHSLRKEYGSQICAQAGIYAASLALRHSSITLTREYYVDKKRASVFEVSKLLSKNAENPSANENAA